MSGAGRPGNPWITLRSSERYANPWIRVVEHDVVDPGGKAGIYGTVHFRNLAIGVVPVHADGTTVLVGQYRYPLERYSWEIPEGGGAHGVEPLLSAQRELREETGLVAASWHQVLQMHLSNSVTDEHALAFLAWDLEEGDAEPESTEELARRRLPFGEVLDLVLSGGITDALSVAAVLAVAAQARRGRLPDGVGEVLRAQLA